ncbi:MAG: low specificity L-threonine aldolase [Lachnospiraceae bacterium]|nr:low specificity L-threonine aldolase [Lachnospiraceae bacterium]
MLNFGCDYLEGAHEKILARFIETNMEKEPGYGADKYTVSAKKKILDACECPDGEVFLLVGGTQTNSTVIDAYLNNYQGVIAAPTGHIACHESGAIESCGHKVLTIPQHLGKIDAGELKEFLVNFYADETYEHQVIPGMVYISHPTEYGTLYTKAELEAIYTICKEYEMPLFVDGARLGYGLAADDTDVTLPDLAKLCDAFYIGGTKVGALCGEAVVFTKKAPKFFFTTVKQHGALLAKGRLVGIQFDTLFTDDLYMEISKHAIRLANILKAGVLAKGYKLLLDSPTNQQFIIVDNEKYAELKKQVAFSTWEKVDADHTAIRFATSWATKEEDVQALLELL